MNLLAFDADGEGRNRFGCGRCEHLTCPEVELGAVERALHRAPDPVHGPLVEERMGVRAHVARREVAAAAPEDAHHHVAHVESPALAVRDVPHPCHRLETHLYPSLRPERPPSEGIPHKAFGPGARDSKLG